MRIQFFSIVFLSTIWFSCSGTNTPEGIAPGPTTISQPTNNDHPAAPVMVENAPIQPAAPTSIKTNEQPAAPVSSKPATRPSKVEANAKPGKEPDARETKPKSDTNLPKPETKPLEAAEKETKAVENTAASGIKEAPAQPDPVTQKEATPPPFSHDAWDGLLKKHVSATGRVDYAGLKAEKTVLEGYLTALQNNPPQANWPKNKTMAYWINAYNAFTVKLILDNYPVASITKLDGGKPWDKKWIKIGDKTYSLNNIENDILRPVYKDARIHFAVNCAAKSCPPLLNRAWTAENMESNFEKQAKAFINNPGFNKITEKEVQVSKIFEWYAADFGDLVAYLNKYSTVKINTKAKVVFMDYNWDLNN